MNELSAKSSQKPTWANVLAAPTPSIPTRANGFNGATFKYPKIIVKTSDEQQIVNKQQGNTKMREGLNHWIAEAKYGPPRQGTKNFEEW